MFDRVVVITLPRLPERLAAFRESFLDFWPFAIPQAVNGIDCSGEVVPKPYGFHGSDGAYGCRQSHCRVLEDAFADNVQSLLVLEDDARLCRDFSDKVKPFLAALPSDWQGIYFGGEHRLMPPSFVSPEVVKCNAVSRTHAYAVRGEYMRALYSFWATATDHIDDLQARICGSFPVYAPTEFLIGQAGGYSETLSKSVDESFYN